MLVKYWKNFKWFLFIPLIIFIFIFNINNVSALVYKASVYNVPTLSSGSASGSLNNNSVAGVKYSLNDFNYNLDYSLLSFKFGTYSISTTDNYNISGTVGDNGGIQTTQCITTTGTSSNIVYYCNATQVLNTQSTSLSSNSVSGFFYLNAELRYVVNGYNVYVPCTLESGQEFQFYCPLVKDYGQPKAFELAIKNGGYDNINYNLTLTGTQYYYNYDSTDITIQQQQTNTNLQYIYQYQQDDSTTGANTQATGDFTQLAQDFNTQLSGVNDLTQLVLLPISLFMDLATDNCQPLHLQIPFVNMSVDLPCMKAVFNQYFSGFYSIFTTIMSAVICYWVAVKTGALVKEIVDCDNDRIEVVDL